MTTAGSTALSPRHRSNTPNANEPSSPALSGVDAHPTFRFLNMLKSRAKPLRALLENIKIGEDIISGVIGGASFEFKYNYTETSKAKPLNWVFSGFCFSVIYGRLVSCFAYHEFFPRIATEHHATASSLFGFAAPYY